MAPEGGVSLPFQQVPCLSVPAGNLFKPAGHECGTIRPFPGWGGMWTYRLPFGALVGLSGVAFFVGLILH
jgi:hypothetical protein